MASSRSATAKAAKVPRAAREGQITDRYTKAVDQLGSQHLDIRLGGIYALQRIARDSPSDRATIEEVLAAYVRGHAPWPPPSAAPSLERPPLSAALSLQRIVQRLAPLAPQQRSARQRHTAKDTAGLAQATQLDKQAAEPPLPAADVQAAVIVLGRLLLSPERVQRLDLVRADLRRAGFERANLQGALLRGTNLQGAILRGANLQGARLDLANLRQTWLDGADLKHASLMGADLQCAALRGANLQHATLLDADLKGAHLGDADLKGAHLGEADLSGADLRGAILLAANLQDARATKATRWPDGWDRARAEGQGVRYLD